MHDLLDSAQATIKYILCVQRSRNDEQLRVYAHKTIQVPPIVDLLPYALYKHIGILDIPLISHSLYYTAYSSLV